MNFELQLSRCYLITQITSRKLQFKITFEEPFLKVSYNPMYYMYPLSSLNCNLNDMQELTKLYTVWYVYVSSSGPESSLTLITHSQCYDEMHNAFSPTKCSYSKIGLPSRLQWNFVSLYDQKPKIIILAPMQWYSSCKFSKESNIQDIITSILIE